MDNSLSREATDRREGRRLTAFEPKQLGWSHQQKWFNRGAERIFGQRVAEAIGRPVTLLMPERYRDLCVAGLHRYLRTGEARVISGTTELVGLRTDGSEFPIEMSLGETRVDKVRQFTAVIRDITERKRNEEALRETQDRFESVFDHAPIGVAIVSPEGRYLRVNRALCEILGSETGKGKVPK
jgi:PAS domain S-box-containing protein